MEENEEILQGVLYNVNTEEGPEVKSHYPKSDFFDLAKLNIIAIKTATLLTGEEGEVPEKISIITFAKYELLGIVYHFEFRDESSRGNYVDSNLVVLFNQKFSSIAYKYSELFEKLLNEVSKNIIENEITNNQENIYNIVQQLYENLLKNLASLRDAEQKALKKIQEPDYRLKVVVIGDPNVGKTTMLLRYVDNCFQENYLPTIGVNISNKRILINGETVLLNFFDIAGQEKFELIRKVFYEGLNGTLIVFDITDKNSFNNLQNWIDDVASAFLPGKIKGLIIGNKVDLRSDREITTESAKALARGIGLEYIEVSAKTGENINEAFSEIAKLMIIE